MGQTVKISVSLPIEILKAVEDECKARGASRSGFFRHAVERLLDQQHAQEAVKRYVESYRQQPETDDEVVLAQQLSSAVLKQEPWA